MNIWFVEVTPWPVKLFLLPFQVIGLCILGAVLVTLFGRGELRVRDGMLETFAGIGGQGVILASDLLTVAAFRSGYDVKKSELHGMSQRGGSVSSDVRFGTKVWSPMVPRGEADGGRLEGGPGGGPETDRRFRLLDRLCK